jgi:hypothetical protein
MDNPNEGNSKGNAAINPRKRSRSTTPLNTALLAAQPRPESSEDLMRAAQLRNPSTRTAQLNALLRLTYSHEANYATTGDSVLGELVNVALECIDWHEEEEEDDDDVAADADSTSSDTSDDEPSFSSAGAWTKPPTARNERWARHWEEQLGPKRDNRSATAIKTLEVIAMIFRNLSYVGANLRMMAYTPAVVDVLIGCMYDGYDNPSARGLGEESANSPSVTTMAVAAMQTLLNMVPYLDLSGQKVLSDKLFYSPHSSKDGPLIPNKSSFGQTVGGSWGFGGMWLARRLDTKEDVMSDTTKGFLLSFTSDYLVAVWSIFPALHSVIKNPLTPRTVLLMAMDLLQELVNQARVAVVGSINLQDDPDELPTLRAVLVQMPAPMLSRLADFIYVPRLGPDALEYVDPVKHIVTRVTTYKLLAGYDGTVDTDIRDRALDLMVPLLELDSPRVAALLGSEPSEEQDDDKEEAERHPKVRTRLWDSLVPILTSTAGRNEAAHLATQVLRELAKAPENRLGLQYIQERLLKLACKNERVAHTCWTYLFLTPQDGEADDDDDESADVQASES